MSKQLRADEQMKILNIILILAIIFSIQQFISDIYNAKTYGAIDLRNRIVGTRLVKLGINPYTFKWNSQTDSLTLLDPFDFPDLKVSRVSIPPSNFPIFSILAKIDNYNRIKFIWMLITWFLFTGTIFFIIIEVRQKFLRRLLVTVGLLYFSIGSFWRLHIEKGQIYIIYVFLIAFSYYIYTQKNKLSEFLSGLIMGINIVLRPFMIFFSIPMLTFGKWKFILGNIIGAIFAFGISLYLYGFDLWKHFFNYVNYQSKMHLKEIVSHSQHYYQIITLKKDFYDSYDFPRFDTSIQKIIHTFFNFELTSSMLKLSLIIVMLFFTLLFFTLRKRKFTIDTIFIIGSLLVIISEFFVPSPRFSYNNVIFLIPLLLIVKNYKEILSRTRKWLKSKKI